MGMKKLISLFCVIAMMAMFSACSPTFRSIKDADDYVAKERASAKDKAHYIVSVPDLLGVASAVITPGTTITAAIIDELASPDEYIIPWSYKYRQIRPPYASAKGSVNFKRRDFVYRQEKGKPAVNLFIEVFKETGEMPDCIITRVLTKNLWHPSHYQGDDGQIVMAEGFFIEVSGASRKGAETTCTPQVLRDYLDKVLNNATNRLNRQMLENNITK